MKKIISLLEIKKYCQLQKNKGKKIVLAHGTFDLLHLGHVKHLEYAKKYGDILIVTITADKYVKKGPDRPYFNHFKRSEMLASLSIVDKVCIVHESSAKDAIKNVQPNIYIKGNEYKNIKNDHTNKIGAEIFLVENFGGKIIYSDEETFSSSNLLNNYFSDRNKSLKLKLKKIKKNNILKKILSDEHKIKKLKICLIGDTIIDTYKFVAPMGKSPKENMLSNLFKNEKKFCGGVLAAANNLSSFCENIEIITHCYNKESEKKFIEKSLDKKIKIKNFKDINVPVTTKIRYLEDGFNRKLFSVYEMNDFPRSQFYENKIVNFLSKNLSKYDVVIVTDFGHGFISKKIKKIIEKKSKFLSVNTQSNSANHGFNLISEYKNAHYICIDLPEARLATKDKHSSPVFIAKKLMKKTNNYKYFSLTLGKNGSLVSTRQSTFQLESFTDSVVDTMGAGDVFFVITSIFAFLNYKIEEISLIGNCAGCLKVKILGHQKKIHKEDLLSLIKTVLM